MTANEPAETAGDAHVDQAIGAFTDAAAPLARRRRPAAPILRARRLVKTFGRVVGLDGVSLELYPGEVLAIIGDNGAGKSTLIKCLTGAEIPDEGEIFLDGKPVDFKRPQDARAAGIETVYQNLAVSPALDVAANLFLGREVRKKGILGSVFRVVDQKGMRQKARDELKALGISTLQDVTVPVENLSGGQRQAVAVARAAAFGSKVVVLDEPTAALGVRESNQVLELIKNLRDRGIPVILISHNMPQVFDVADRIHIQRLGKRAATITPESHSMTDAVAIMTGCRTRMSWSSDEDRVELIARFTALPGRGEEVARLLLALTAKVREEPGCLAFEPYRVGAGPVGVGRDAEPEPVGTGFVVIEAYRDEAAFAAHLAAEYGAEFNAALGPLIVEDGSVLTFMTPIG